MVDDETGNREILLYDTPFEVFNNRSLNTLILHEECGELIQISAKVERFGPQNFNPSDPKRVTNREVLVKEIGDVLAMISIIADDPHLKISEDEMQQAKYAKMRKLLKFYRLNNVDQIAKSEAHDETHFRSYLQSKEICDAYGDDETFVNPLKGETFTKRSDFYPGLDSDK